MRRLLPDPAADLSDDDLPAAYAVPTRRHLRVNFVTSADGAVAVDGVSGGLSSAADRRVFGVLRDLADVVLVGAGTARAEGYSYRAPDGPRRARRRAAGVAELPTFAVVSGSLDLDPTSSLFADALARTVVLTTARAPADRRTALAAVADVLVVGQDTLDPAAALDALADRGLRRVLCEGGPALFGALLAADVVDEVCLTVAPLFAGAGSGRVVAGPPAAARTARLLHVLEDGGTLLLRYAV